MMLRGIRDSIESNSRVATERQSCCRAERLDDGCNGDSLHVRGGDSLHDQDHNHQVVGGGP